MIVCDGSQLQLVEAEMECVSGLNWEVYRAHIQKFPLSFCTLALPSCYVVACLIRFHHIHAFIQHISMYHVPDRPLPS